MRSRIALCTVAVLVLVMGAGAPGEASVGGHRICLDPGHGGPDPGATYAGLREADLTYDIAQRLASQLSGAGAIVTFTRTLSEDPSNSERARRCNAAAAEAVLSIHLNAASDPAVDYAEIFYGMPRKDGPFARTIDANYRLTRPGSADPLPHANVTNFANGTLLKSNAPAALAETVFLSNRDEQIALADGSGTRQAQIAQQLQSGLAAWFR